MNKWLEIILGLVGLLIIDRFVAWNARRIAADELRRLFDGNRKP